MNVPEGLTPPDLSTQVERAKEGDRQALEAIVAAVRDSLYNLALRMLWHPADAEDATQEILIRIVTHLGSFRGESAFTTWAYRVASNYLLTTRKRRAEREELTFARFAEQLDEGLGPAEVSLANDVEQRLLLEEVKIGCTQGMLLCLDRDHRLAYILGHVFALKSQEAAEITGVTPATFRKRLSRARKRLHQFMERKCGLVNEDCPCRCERRLDYAVETGRIDPGHLLFARQPVAATPDGPTLKAVREMEHLHSAADLLRGHPHYAMPGQSAAIVRRLLETSCLGVAAKT